MVIQHPSPLSRSSFTKNFLIWQRAYASRCRDIKEQALQPINWLKGILTLMNDICTSRWLVDIWYMIDTPNLYGTYYRELAYNEAISVSPCRISQYHDTLVTKHSYGVYLLTTYLALMASYRWTKNAPLALDSSRHASQWWRPSE